MIVPDPGLQASIDFQAPLKGGGGFLLGTPGANYLTILDPYVSDESACFSPVIDMLVHVASIRGNRAPTRGECR